MDVAFERYAHADPAFEIDLPAGAEVGTVAGTLVVARAPQSASSSPFRSNLTIVAEELPADVDPAEHEEASLVQEAAGLPGWRLIDRATDTIDGDAASRTLATYMVGRGSGVDVGRDLPVTLEQWRLVRGGHAWIASASCETGDYALFGQLWATCATSLRVGRAAS